MKKIDTAMILAAGYGSRLRPLTDTLPKALVEFKGRPMIENVIGKLESAGITNIVINAHHHHEKMEEYFSKRDNSSNIQLVYEKEILGTGGAIRNAENLLSGAADFLVYNTDVDCEIDLDKFSEFHFKTETDATLAVQKRVTKRYLLTSPEGELLGRTEEGQPVIFNINYENNDLFDQKAFCGIHILSSSIFEYIPYEGKVDIIPVYISMLKQGIKVMTYDITNTYWKDLGIAENL